MFPRCERCSYFGSYQQILPCFLFGLSEVKQLWGGSPLWAIYKPWQAPCATVKGLKQVLQVMERDWSELEAHDNIKPNIRTTHTHTEFPWVMRSSDWTEFSPSSLLPIREEMSAHMESIINLTLTHHRLAQCRISVCWKNQMLSKIFCLHTGKFKFVKCVCDQI